MIDEVDDMPSSSVYRSRFGSLMRAYQLVGYNPGRDYQYVETNRALRSIFPEVLAEAIGSLKKRGYSHNQIAAKTDFSPEYIYAICYLLDHGEERLLTAVERGIIPHSIAMEIARAKDGEVQKALAQAYESGSLPGNQIIAIRRIVEQRNLTGKSMHSVGRRQPPKKEVTPGSLVRAYQKEAGRQKLVVKKATLAQERLVFVVNALRSLLGEPSFVKLLRTEDMHTLPRPIADRVGAGG